MGGRTAHEEPSNLACENVLIQADPESPRKGGSEFQLCRHATGMPPGMNSSEGW
jgi:hypothetical protein